MNENVLMMAVIKQNADDIIDVTIKKNKKRKKGLNKVDAERLWLAEDFLFTGMKLHRFCEFAGFQMTVKYLRCYVRKYINKHVKNAGTGKHAKYSPKDLF